MKENINANKFYKLVDEKYLKPIKKYDRELKNWDTIPIEDCKEKLVSLKNVSTRIIIEPQYFINRISGAENDCKVRESIKYKLIKIADKLPKGYKLLVWDGYRTIETQQSLYDYYYKIFNSELHLNEIELKEYTKKFVSLPSTDKRKPSPHNTGAAIDITICNELNIPINLGTFFDDFEEKSYTRYYENKLENKQILNKEEKEILYNRRVLCNLFEEEGFVNYPYEIWHKSFKDQMYCELMNESIAIYNGIESE